MSSFTQKKHARKEEHLKLLINGGKKSKMHGIKSTHDPFLSLPVYKQAPSVARWPTILWNNLLYSNINSNESDLILKKSILEWTLLTLTWFLGDREPETSYTRFWFTYLLLKLDFKLFKFIANIYAYKVLAIPFRYFTFN